MQHRLQWEKQWLAENRSAFDTIKNNSETAPRYSDNQYLAQAIGDSEKDLGTAAHLNADAAERVPNMIRTDGYKNSPNASRLEAKNNFETPFNYEMPCFPVSRQRTFTASAILGEEVGEHYRRYEFRQFALWRDGKHVAVSMRLPKDVQDDRSILQLMRQWLADAGYVLKSVIVNGKSRWK